MAVPSPDIWLVPSTDDSKPAEISISTGRLQFGDRRLTGLGNRFEFAKNSTLALSSSNWRRRSRASVALRSTSASIARTRMEGFGSFSDPINGGIADRSPICPKRPWNNVAYVGVLQERHEDGDSTRVLQVTEQMRGVVTVLADLRLDRGETYRRHLLNRAYFGTIVQNGENHLESTRVAQTGKDERGVSA